VTRERLEGNHVILRHERLPDERFFSGSQNVGFPTVVLTANSTAIAQRRLEKSDEELNPL